MSNAALRLGIVGCGAVVEQYHLPAVRASERVALAALVDTSRERALALAAETDTAVLSDHRGLSGVVDAAIVAVPNDLHAPIAIDLLQAGIHVLVEKPLAPTVAACDAVIEAAEKHGSTLAVGLDFRFAPAIRLVKELLAQSVLGPVRGFDLRHGTVSRWPLATSYLFDPARAGGGVLLDHGAHLLDHLLWWLGPCSAEVYRDDARGGVETDAEAVLLTTAGVRGTVELSRTRALRNTCRIECELGMLEVQLFEPHAEVILRLSADVSPLAGRVGDDRLALQPYRVLFERQLDAFVDAIAFGRRPFVPGSEGRRTVALIEECYARREQLDLPWDVRPVHGAAR